MFTGLIQTVGEITAVEERPPGRLIALRAPALGKVSIGDSVSINGCCLTCINAEAGLLSFEAGAETLSRTNLGGFTVGSRANLELSLAVGDRMGGHFVTGHIDAVGTLDARHDNAAWSTFWFRFPPALRRQMASKGSIAVDGVSLTLVEVEPARFSVALIPHTLSNTTLGGLKVGGQVNLETDLLAKYVAEQFRAAASPPAGRQEHA